MYLIAGNDLIMEQPSNSPSQRTHNKQFPRNESLDYKKSQEHYFYTPKKLVWQYWSPWEQFQKHKIVEQSKAQIT